MSRLSPALAFGELSAREAYVCAAAAGDALAPWQRQLVWRVFGRNLLAIDERLPDQPLQPRFGAFPWRDDAAALRAWQRGRTGYPIVDAGMRELWARGWMHNRVRMIVGSFLVKDLLLPWQAGERWFWDTLVDADLGNNAMGWQWVAGCGADAAPYFRVFHPTTQSRRYDADGAYLRRWLPELALLPDRWIHEPAAAPPLVLLEAGVRLGRDYPMPIVDHAAARDAALAAFRALPPA